MATEGKTYICEMCGSEVKVIKKTVPYLNAPLLYAVEKR